MCAGGIDLQMPAFCVCIVLVVFTLSFVVDTYEALTPTLLTMLTTLTMHTMLTVSFVVDTYEERISQLHLLYSLGIVYSSWLYLLWQEITSQLSLLTLTPLFLAVAVMVADRVIHL